MNRATPRLFRDAAIASANVMTNNTTTATTRTARFTEGPYR